jgi:phenylacetate-CoA ligase
MKTRNSMSTIWFTSSGTSGKAKVSRFDKDEWKENIRLICKHHGDTNSLRNGDTVANLANPGHASIMLVHDTLLKFPQSLSEILIDGQAALDDIAELLIKSECNVLTGVYSTIISLANYLDIGNLRNENIERILGGGECLYGAQAKLLKKAFPNAVYKSFVYGSTDCGLIGFNPDYENSNVFEVCEEACKIEILDIETNKPIEQVNKKGYVIITNLLRKNALVNKYSNGDFAQWTTGADTNKKYFQLSGRTFKDVSIFNEKLPVDCFFKVINQIGEALPITRFQILIESQENYITVTLCYSLMKSINIDKSIGNSLLYEMVYTIFPPNFKKLLDNGQLRLSTKGIELDSFMENTRKRGKIILDLRSNPA